MAVGKKKIRIGIWSVVGLLVVTAAVVAFTLYSWIYRPALTNVTDTPAYLYIPTGSDYDDLLDQLDQLEWHRNVSSFDWVAKKKNLPSHLYPGRYEVFNGMSNDSLINLLRSGKQSEVSLIFTAKRTLADLADVIAAQIEADSLSLISVFTDSTLIDSLGFRPETWMGMFIPNTYRFFWNSDAHQFVTRMHKEFLRFWNEERRIKLKDTGLNVDELMTLASIVQDETARIQDMPRIAGVYMNRLESGIRLQACPTVIYAWGEPRIRRLLNEHLKIRSPYNTYIHRGLPPGPIRIASIQAIEACLDYERHDYYYFSASEDFTGGTVFAKSYREHLNNARKYQRVLNERNIY